MVCVLQNVLQDVLQETKEVKPRRSSIDSRKADKKDDSGIKCELFSCIFS